MNIADAFAATHGGEGWEALERWLDDGRTCHAPVGSYRANPFGLHDVMGNVIEWCLDGFQFYFSARSPPIEPDSARGDPNRTSRGGSFGSSL